MHNKDPLSQMFYRQILKCALCMWLCIKESLGYDACNEVKPDGNNIPSQYPSVNRVSGMGWKVPRPSEWREHLLKSACTQVPEGPLIGNSANVWGPKFSLHYGVFNNIFFVQLQVLLVPIKIRHVTRRSDNWVRHLPWSHDLHFLHYHCLKTWRF